MLPDQLLEHPPRFELLSGDLTHIDYLQTGWREMPVLMIAQYHPGFGTLHLDHDVHIDLHNEDCILVMPGVRHNIIQKKNNAVSRWVHVNFYLMGNTDLFHYCTLPSVIQSRKGRIIGDCIEQWFTDVRKLPSGPSLLRNAKMAQFGMKLLELLCPYLQSRETMVEWPADKSRQHAREMIRPALELLEHDYAKPFLRDDLAARVNFSPAQFHRVFLKATGITPMEYRMRLRLRKSQLLLMTTDLAVKEIARRVGYEDQFVFSKAFKQRFGQSPLSYRTAINSQRL